jgi:CBS domain containing-hemolysin-like protein
MTTLGYVPKEGERFEAFGYLFEVIDMDNNRIDKVLVTQVAEQKAVGE